MKKISVLMIVLFVCLSLGGCGKSLDEQVTLKQDKVEVGTQVNLVELFECEEGVNIGIKNADSFDTGKVGAYSVDFTITDGDEEIDKSFIINVTDEKAPDITAKEEVVLYEKDVFDPNKYASVTDNSKEDVALEVAENNVDVNKAGEYVVKYQAKDSSGNTSEKDMKVVVKKVYSFSERKKLAKKVIKDGKYNDLKIKTDTNKKLIWIDLKNEYFSVVTKKNYIYLFSPYLTLSQEGKKLKTELYVNFTEADTDGYLSPKSMYIRSDKGTINTNKGSISDFDYDYGYNYPYSSFCSFYFTKEKDLDKLNNVLTGDYLKFAIYMDKKDFKYNCKKSEIKEMKELLGFYNDLKTYL